MWLLKRVKGLRKWPHHYWMRKQVDRIIIENLSVMGILGIHAGERVKPQEIRISIFADVDLSEAGQNDDIQSTVDYETLVHRVTAYTLTANKYTAEALAEDLAKLCLSNNRIAKIRIKIIKPTALPNVSAVGVEIERERD